MRSIPMPCLLALALVLAPPQKQPVCPDVEATLMDSVYSDQGPYTACVKTPIQVLGGNGTGWVPKCPRYRVLTPAHGECQGEPNPGTRCLPAGELPVQLMQCECSPVIKLPSGWTAAGCTCTHYANVGTVETFATLPC